MCGFVILTKIWKNDPALEKKSCRNVFRVETLDKVMKICHKCYVLPCNESVSNILHTLWVDGKS